MTNGLGALCDEFYVNGRLFLKLDLAPGRETILHFFDRVRKEYSALRKLRRRDSSSVMLEEEPDAQGSRRWLRIDTNCFRFGQFSVQDREDTRRFGEFVLGQAPYHLSFSDLDYDHLEVTYAFELAYRGNHDQLVADTLLGENALASFLMGDHAAKVIDAQPYFGIALTPECDLQAYVEIKSRTSTFEVRSDHYEGAPITVFLTVRKYWDGESMDALSNVLRTLFDTADELAIDKIVPNFVNPLAAAIASRS
jgi:hypothetical protein